MIKTTKFTLQGPPSPMEWLDTPVISWLSGINAVTIEKTMMKIKTKDFQIKEGIRIKLEK